MSGGAITEMGSADRAGWMRAIEAAVRRVLGAGVAIAARFTSGVTIAPSGTATTALTVTGPSAPTVELAVWDASALTNGQAVHMDKAGHLRFSQLNPPTIAAGAAAGTGATVSLLAGSTDQSGTIQIVTGTGTAGAGGLIATVTFRNAYATTPKAIILEPTNSNAQNLARNQDVKALRAGSGTGSFQVVSGSAALGASVNSYEWYYWVAG